MDSRGLTVASLVLILIAVLVGVAVYPTIYSVIEETIAGTKTSTVNSTFDTNANGWENVVQGNATSGWENIGTNGMIYAKTTDNDATKDNVIWSQSLSVGTLAIDEAIVKFAWSVAENTGISSLTLKAILENTSGDNITLWQSTATATSAFASVENDVKSYITATGSYKLKLRAEMLGSGASVSVKVQWDNASLEFVSGQVTGAQKTMLKLVPLLFVVGLLLVAVSWATKYK